MIIYIEENGSHGPPTSVTRGFKKPLSEVAVQTRESLKRPYFPLPRSILAGLQHFFYFSCWLLGKIYCRKLKLDKRGKKSKHWSQTTYTFPRRSLKEFSKRFEERWRLDGLCDEVGQ